MVPDGLLFSDEAAKDRANRLPEQDRYRLGLAIVESKRWGRPLDRRSGADGAEAAPATQMLSYLGRADVMTEGSLRWGILTDGAVWRLYWWGARSVAEQFFEVDLAAVLDLPGRNEGLFALDGEARRHWLQIFALVFRPEAFLPGEADPRSFHLRAIEESRLYEAEVAKDLSGLVFGEAFPKLAGAIAGAAPDAPLDEVREAALVLLYRLMFVLYAEDRGLLPVRDTGYDDYALRERVREDIGRRKDAGDAFSTVAANYWSAIDDLCRIIDGGDASIGLPAYNGGLFDAGRAPLLAQVRLDDAVMADIVGALSFRRGPEGRRYINYRELGVQQLGSIYERLVERELVREEGEIRVRPNPFVRKDWGSYYTPDDLVGLVIEETVGPLAEARGKAFRDAAEKSVAPAKLARLDPATKILELRVCDPAMGSGHFLVNLVDWLADRTIEAMAEAEALSEGYASPLAGRIEDIRNTILANAEAEGWTVDAARLDDRHIVRRMVLKRCIYGVDKNPMAVELAKVSLWLHTFTVGAPLSFLDHHLRCGDSLFGAWARTGLDRAAQYDAPLLLHGPVQAAISATEGMRAVEALTDAEIAEVRQSAETFARVKEKTGPLDAFLSLTHAFDWLNIQAKDDKAALRAFFDGQFGDPVAIARGAAKPEGNGEQAGRFAELLANARALVREERFFNWQAAFPGVWTNLESAERRGGFDAVIGNPPWDRMRIEPIEWFIARDHDVALAHRSADRKQMVAQLRKSGDPLAKAFDNATHRAESAARVARTCGDYPLLAFGELNLYALFVERAIALVNSDGIVGLLTPSGIASDKTAARFFKSVATQGRLKTFLDFENKKRDRTLFFPDVHAQFKFCVFVSSVMPTNEETKYAFFLHDVNELEDPNRCFPLSHSDFARVNPNTGTAPIFRSRRDAKLTTGMYKHVPVMVNHSLGDSGKTWPVKYVRMFDMSLNSELFRTREELEEKEGAWPIGGNRFDASSGRWVPLYEG
ncbi:MAG: restriction endonuclease, partial [Alphaproteobacteria bacterium]|nr:restriction endonuclease [Alphaproteobacteria bacterium]